ncbi:MAG: acyl carrier protein [Cyanobacteria bacterium J06623_5]
MTVSNQQTATLLTDHKSTNVLAKNFPVPDEKAEQIQEWIVCYLSDLLEISTDEIETDVPFDTYGLDSSAAIGLTGDLEDWLGQSVDPTLLYDYPTVDALVAHLCEA